MRNFKEKLSENWETLPNYIITSSEKYRGRNEVLTYIQEIIQTQQEIEPES